jgi:pimeloyl-ACP methyl ester carboxylesterase
MAPFDDVPRPLVADVSGAGPAVVLLHGQPGGAADWEAVTRLLEPSFTVVVPDRPGYGRTGGRASGFGANADAVVDLLDELAIDRAIVAGHSWGGGAAIALAQRAPGRVSGLVLVASVGPGERPGRLDRALAIAPLGSALAAITLKVAGRVLSLPLVRRLVDRRLRGFTHEGLVTMAATWRQGEAWRSFVTEQRALIDELPDLASGLAQLARPVTVVVGAADRIVPAATGQHLAAAIPGSRLITLDGAGHLLPHERPDAVAAAIVEVAAAARRHP